MKSHWYLLVLSFYTAVSFLPVVYAQNDTAVSATGCVDESGMQSCLDTANTKWTECVAAASDSEVCLWAKDVDQIACYLEVYSCEYQILVGDLLAQQASLPNQTIPFWPAPTNAPGGCSCNFGDIYQNATASMELIKTKCDQDISAEGTALETCQCCVWSSVVSAFYGFCPGYDLTNYGLSILDDAAIASGSSSCAGLTSSVCLGTFGIGSADNGIYINPGALPSGGDKVLSTTEGSGPLTTPPGGATMTVTLLTSTYTITAAPYNGKNAGSGSTTITTATTSPTSTSQGQSSSSTSKTNSASTLRYAPMCSLVWLVLLFIQ